MKPLKYLFLFVISLTITASCKKEEAKVYTKSEILTAHPWKILSSTENGVSALMDCEKDNVLTFLGNGTHTSNPGSIKCDVQETIINGTWVLSNDGTQLSITENDDDGNPHSYTVTVTELTQSRLTIRLQDGTYVYEQIFVPL